MTGAHRPFAFICESEIWLVYIPPKACGLLVRVASAVGIG